MSEPLLIARTPDTELFLLPGMANRHGLITGATGTGKTVTLQKLAESLSEIGVPVFMADVKGDLTGIAQAGTASEKLLARLKNIGVNDWQPHANPWWCGISLARKAIRCGRRFRIWGRCCWRGC
jgi:signal recognition particle GTPase